MVCSNLGMPEKSNIQTLECGYADGNRVRILADAMLDAFRLQLAQACLSTDDPDFLAAAAVAMMAITPTTVSGN